MLQRGKPAVACQGYVEELLRNYCLKWQYHAGIGCSCCCFCFYYHYRCCFCCYRPRFCYNHQRRRWPVDILGRSPGTGLQRSDGEPLRWHLRHHLRILFPFLSSNALLSYSSSSSCDVEKGVLGETPPPPPPTDSVAIADAAAALLLLIENHFNAGAPQHHDM